MACKEVLFLFIAMATFVDSLNLLNASFGSSGVGNVSIFPTFFYLNLLLHLFIYLPQINNILSIFFITISRQIVGIPQSVKAALNFFIFLFFELQRFYHDSILFVSQESATSIFFQLLFFRLKLI